ncbi:MAG TPA: DUF4129 domain-containing protein [Flavobacterium sp.]
MRKLLSILFLFLALEAMPQDSLQYAEHPIVLAEKEIRTDVSAVREAKFDTDFKSKYSGNDFVYELKAKEKTLWDRFLEWLGSLIQNLFQISSTEKAGDIALFVVKAIAILIVLTVIYLIVKAILNKEGKWIFGRNLSKKIVYHDVSEVNLQATDFEMLVTETVASGNLRLAVRYYYLWLLKRLSEKGYIHWDVEKTNSDYLHELQNPALQQEFSYLSYLYNYIWYGEFEVDEETFGKTKKAFEAAIKSIR